MKKNKKILLFFILGLGTLVFFNIAPAQALVGGSVPVGSCLSDADCLANEFCVTVQPSGCLPKKELGSLCGRKEECLSNNCETGQDGKTYCVNPKTGEGYTKWQPVAPRLQINIPTWTPFTESDIKQLKQLDAEGNVYIPFIGQYIAAIYRWLILIAGIVAAVMVMLGGFIYLTAGGNAQRTQEGKDRIAHALLGLLLLLGSYSLLYIINPDLVKFKSLKIKVIERREIELKQIVDAGTDNGFASENVMAICAPEDDLQTIQNIVSVSGAAAVGNPTLRKEAAEALKKANEIAKTKGRELQVISATRTLKRQTELWNEALKKYGTEEEAKKYVAKPSCNAPHLTGRAADICLKDSSTCEKIKSEFADSKDPDITLLQEILKEAGWQRYCNEWWHFEYNLPALNRCSP